LETKSNSTQLESILVHPKIEQNIGRWRYIRK